jgi:chemotaxis protein histidine kinase CheA
MLLSTYIALTTLDISVVEVLTAARVNSAWKAKIKAVHPDKNPGAAQAAATALSQKYNDARDTLLKHLQNPEDAVAKKAMDEEYERAAVERDKAIAKAKAAAAAAAKADAGAAKAAAATAKAAAAAAKAAAATKAAEDAAAAKAAEEAAAAKAAEEAAAAKAAEAAAAATEAAATEAAEAAAEAAAGKKKRRRRAPGSRLHRKVDSYDDGKLLLQSMRQYFLETYSYNASAGSRVMVSDILEGFMNFRPSTTRAESNLFQRHSKVILMETMPGVSYSKYKDKRCFVRLERR